MFCAQLEQLGCLISFVEKGAGRLAASSESVLRLAVIAEELFVNSVRHGHGGDSDLPVWVSLGRRKSSLIFALEDLAPAFNPYPQRSTVTTAPVGGDIESRPVGGLGLLLTRELSSAQEYAYLFGRNCVRLHIPC